ncbi:hypothetical protein [Paracidovorax valerianellae]|uniref:Uncharacterized protein n=1 Tax=Paracidovorax valerianellae TaxID=187868 RepID=A0A1G6S199_9BURK|nr:hypothetical protein [Paracidovorax valerianellae]MDA8444151.1 hypothetical protein [Paracidovorax valerianellae]SDD10443.1 hypothetical protein SAMN05192589_104302 [Paracidovorax valerianellae]
MPTPSTKSPSRVPGTMEMGSSGIAPPPEPGVWLDSNASEAKAARSRLLDSATGLQQVHDTLRFPETPCPLDTYITGECPVQHAVVVPAKELHPGLLRADRFMELSSQRLTQANVLSTTHPGVTPLMPDMAPRLRVISPAAATHLALAREAIDLVKALLPAGAGNQIKDIAATGAENCFRSAMSYRGKGDPATCASAAIKYQAGNCNAQASLAFQLLSQNPDLQNSRIDIVFDGPGGGHDHVFAVIRGQTPEQDIVVDPWAPFATPTFVVDALPMYRDLLSAGQEGIRHTKPAGTVSPPTLDIDEALREQGTVEKNPPLSEQYLHAMGFDRELGLAIYLGHGKGLWDVPFSGNPNVRYEVQDESGHKLTDFPLRFDMQRTGMGQQLER